MEVDPVWDAEFAVGANGASFLRDADSEYKMLNDLARKLEPSAVDWDVFDRYSGEIMILSEISYCSSCSGVIQKFGEMFPNIRIVLIDGVK